MKSKPQPAKPDFAGTSVLVVDDSTSSRAILEEMLSSWGMRVVVAGSADSALAGLKQQSFHLVLLDYTMPEMDGVKLAARFRSHACPMQSVIMMLTSSDYHERATQCRELGIGACVVKPPRSSELAAAIAGILHPRPAPAIEEKLIVKQPAPVVRSPLKILLAEDNLVNQKLAVRLLEKNGHSVAVAQTGKEALDQLENSSFDLVLMDVQMPEMDGLTATAAIRRRETQTGTHIPIIAMTAHAMKGDRERCLEAGMDEYLAKPINVTALHQTITRVLGSLQEASPV